MREPPEQLHARFQQAFNRHDLNAVVALYEPMAVMAGSGEPARGIDAIREGYRQVFTRRPSIALQTLGVHRAGELAMLHGRWTLREIGPDGGEILSEGRNTEVVRQQDDGRWLFVIDDPSAPV